MKFNKGDIVICVDNKDVQDELTLGKKYAVMDCFGKDYVQIKCETRRCGYDWFFPKRFKKAAITQVNRKLLR